MLFVVASLQGSEISRAACMFRINRYQFSKIVFRLVQLVQLKTDVTRLKQRLDIIRLSLQKRLIMAQRLIGHPPNSVNFRQIPKRPRVTRRQIHTPDFPVSIQSIIQLIGIEQHGGPIEVSVRVDTSEISAFLENLRRLQPLLIVSVSFAKIIKILFDVALQRDY